MGIFGDWFDFDGDGNSSMFEELLGLELLGFFDSGDDSEEAETSDNDIFSEDEE